MQHVNFPTRARATDTAHLLDLVFTDDSIVHNINALAPLGKSDHAILMIETNVCNNGPLPEKKLTLIKVITKH